MASYKISLYLSVVLCNRHRGRCAYKGHRHIRTASCHEKDVILLHSRCISGKVMGQVQSPGELLI